MDLQPWLHGGTVVAIVLGVGCLVFWLGRAFVSFTRFVISLFRVRSLVERVEIIELQLRYPMSNPTTLSRLILDNNKTIERLDMEVRTLHQGKLKKAKS